jgi:hypothetical protein
VFGIETLGANAQAATLVGIVLVEAVLLYVVYGQLESTVGGTVTRVLQGQCAVVDAVFRRCSASESGDSEE